MIEPTKDNWQEQVLDKVRLNPRDRLIDQISTHRANLLSSLNRPKVKYDTFDVFILANIQAQGYLDQPSRDLLRALDPDIDFDLSQLYELLTSCLLRIAKLHVPDTGKLKDLLSYL